VAMFGLAAGEARTGAALGNPLLATEGKVTLINGILAASVLLGLVVNGWLGWWWADPAVGYVLAFYAAREVREAISAHCDSLPGLRGGCRGRCRCGARWWCGHGGR
jgi:divalent metal cation (Fe/Co/Zn/Cd) transporter